MIACLSLDPFALWHAERRHPGVPVVVLDGGRVRHANREAVRGGVACGMPLSAALSRVPDLVHEAFQPSLLAAQWAALVESLFAFSPRIEVVEQGRMLLTLTEGAAQELAGHVQGRVGLAGSREMAVLAAQVALEGRAKVVRTEQEGAFLKALPLRALRGVGLSTETLRRLHFLGLRDTGALLRWTKGQQASFLGAEWPLLRPYLHGPGTNRVAAHRPAPDVEVGLAFDGPIHEPGELRPALGDLAEQASKALGGRNAARLVVRATTAGGTLEAAREAKGDVRNACVLERLAALALHDLGPDVFALGLDGLTLRLSGLHQPARQVGLWENVAASEATRAVLARYPHALVRVEWLFTGQYGFDLQYRWVDVTSGAAQRVEPPVPVPSRGSVQPSLFAGGD